MPNREKEGTNYGTLINQNPKSPPLEIYHTGKKREETKYRSVQKGQEANPLEARNRGGGKETSSAEEAVAGSTRADDMEFLSPPCPRPGGAPLATGHAAPQPTPPTKKHTAHHTAHHRHGLTAVKKLRRHIFKIISAVPVTHYRTGTPHSSQRRQMIPAPLIDAAP